MAQQSAAHGPHTIRLPDAMAASHVPSLLAAEPAGVYLHWPFCERKCPYCDFYTFGREHPAHTLAAQYAQALLDEIGSAAARLGWAEPPRVDTLYFGGGTPSLMGASTLQSLLDALHSAFRIEPGAEITLEVNPTTAEAADLPALLALGVNRISFGSQSFSDRVLAQLGRVHDAATTRRAIELARAAGVTNLSLDLIFAAPTQTLDDFANDLETVLAFAPEHISAYNLTLHEGTPYASWAQSGKLDLPEEDEQVAMFEHLIERLAAAGYEHYEISNWSLPGRASRHNSKYWRDCDVIGFGVAAHGVIARQRMETPRDLHAYLDSEARTLAQPITPPGTARARAGEVMMLALRRVAGTPWDELARWLGRDARDLYGRELTELMAEELIEPIGTGPLRLTRRGILLADTVMERFF